jgi:hypothetical protein
MPNSEIFELLGDDRCYSVLLISLSNNVQSPK